MTKYFWTIILNPGKADYDIRHHRPGKINKQHHHLGCVVIIYAILVAVSGTSIVDYYSSLLAIVVAVGILFPFRAAFANFFPATFLKVLFVSGKGLCHPNTNNIHTFSHLKSL